MAGYGFSLIRIFPYKGRILAENTGKEKPVF